MLEVVASGIHTLQTPSRASSSFSEALPSDAAVPEDLPGSQAILAVDLAKIVSASSIVSPQVRLFISVRFETS